MKSDLRPLIWVSSTKRDLLAMPSKVIEDFGYGLYEAQLGLHPSSAKVMKGFGKYKVCELKQDQREGTFRVVYTISFKEAIFILHAFQKKSKRGIETPKEEIELIDQRLKLAETIYNEWKEEAKNG